MGIKLNQCRTSRLPSGSDQNFGWSIKRAPAGSTMKLIVISSDIFGIRTHYFRGRTGPCIIEECDACLALHVSRWKGYLLTVDQADNQLVVFEFTPPAARALDIARQEHGTMRGFQLLVSRASSKANARVVVQVKGITVLGPNACPDYSVWPILAKIWGIASDDVRDIQLGDLKDLSDHEKSA